MRDRWTSTKRDEVEHSNAMDVDDSDIEGETSAEEFVDTLCEETRVEMQLLAKDLAKWATKGARLIGDAFGQRALEDAFKGNICFDKENTCYEVTTDEHGVAIVHDLTQGAQDGAEIGAR